MTATAVRESCQAHPSCDRAPFFGATLKAKAGQRPVRRDVKLCAVHLGDVVQLLIAWASEHGLTQGQVTVLIIDRSPLKQPLAPQPVDGYTFGKIQLAR
jgi:hypothetical protein